MLFRSGGKYGEYGNNQFFIGSPKPQKLGIEQVATPQGTFSAYELAAYPALQRKVIDAAFQHGEQVGVVKPGTVQMQILEDIERESQVKNLSKIPMEKTVPNKVEGAALIEGQETQNVFEGVSKIQQAKMVMAGKGSFVTNMMKGWVKRPQGDVLDLESVSPKNTAKIQKIGRAHV